MKRLIGGSWVLILLWLLLSGYQLAMGNGDQFQRAGALGVAAVVTFFAVLQMRVLNVRDQAARLLRDARRVEATQARINRVDTLMIGAQALFANLATLQWGYGDLAVNRVNGCGAWTC